MLQVHKARAQSLELELERTLQELKGLQVRQQMLETELSQAQRQNAINTDVSCGSSLSMSTVDALKCLHVGHCVLA